MPSMHLQCRDVVLSSQHLLLPFARTNTHSRALGPAFFDVAATATATAAQSIQLAFERDHDVDAEREQAYHEAEPK